jgi:peptidoglycan/LPS O-acetylase OafA/YrhL
MEHRKNNFDFLRLVFATFVIITHSYPLSGMLDCDFLCKITNNQVNFSYLGVKGFFIISGYLIFQSLERSKNILDYFWKRILRLFPALIIVLILTIILVPFIYHSEIPIYKNKSYLTYIPNNLILYKTQYTINGVFENNPYKSVINGSLWTIPYEFTMYALLSLFILFKKKKTIIKILLSLLLILLMITNLFFSTKLFGYNSIIKLDLVIDLGVFFMAGSFLAAFNFDKIYKQKSILLILSILLITSLYLNIFEYTRYILLPLIVILFALNPIPYFCDIGKKIGDLSYGIYIYGFITQQILMHFFKLNYIELMIYSILISSLLGYLSWHIIEKQALKYKKLVQF